MQEDTPLVAAMRTLCKAMILHNGSGEPDLIIQISPAKENPIFYETGEASSHAAIKFFPLIQELVAELNALPLADRICPKVDLILEAANPTFGSEAGTAIELFFSNHITWSSATIDAPEMLQLLESRLNVIASQSPPGPTCEFEIQTKAGHSMFNDTILFTIPATSAKEALHIFGAIRNSESDIEYNIKDVVSISMNCPQETWGLESLEKNQ